MKSPVAALAGLSQWKERRAQDSAQAVTPSLLGGKSRRSAEGRGHSWGPGRARRTPARPPGLTSFCSRRLATVTSRLPPRSIPPRSRRRLWEGGCKTHCPRGDTRHPPHRGSPPQSRGTSRSRRGAHCTGQDGRPALSETTLPYRRSEVPLSTFSELG